MTFDPHKKETIEYIVKSSMDNNIKIIKLYAIAMLNYRQDLGNIALEEIHKLNNKDTVNAWMFITGFMLGKCRNFPDFNEMLN